MVTRSATALKCFGGDAAPFVRRDDIEAGVREWSASVLAQEIGETPLVRHEDGVVVVLDAGEQLNVLSETNWMAALWLPGD